jgi:hypothetical protein
MSRLPDLPGRYRNLHCLSANKIGMLRHALRAPLRSHWSVSLMKMLKAARRYHEVGGILSSNCDAHLRHNLVRSVVSSSHRSMSAPLHTSTCSINRASPGLDDCGRQWSRKIKLLLSAAVRSLTLLLRIEHRCCMVEDLMLIMKDSLVM